jgi:hypothetical protein
VGYKGKQEVNDSSRPMLDNDDKTHVDYKLRIIESRNSLMLQSLIFNHLHPSS